MLGLDPMYLACEGTMVMVVPGDKTDRVLEILRQQPHTEGAKAIGTVTEEEAGKVVLRTQIGTQTYLPQPGNELLPRIC
jgi:hydrogenase expression/formation protein HypE